MRPPPPELPPATSRKWHSRRHWDFLGYLRVRSLANPRWNRDLPWLIDILRRETPSAGHPLRPLYDRAVRAAIRFPRTLGGRLDAEASWDELLSAVHAHLDDVRAAGVSGKDVPREAH